VRFIPQVHHVRPRVVILVDDEGNEIVLPKEKQIPSDFSVKEIMGVKALN
jgi:N utilization substance protein A